VKPLFDINVILRPSDVPPSGIGHRVVGVLNPAAAMVNGETRLLVRVIEGYERNAAYDNYFTRGTPLPRYVYLPRARGGHVEWEKKRLDSEVKANDRYSVLLPGLVEVVRPTVISHARLAVIHRQDDSGPPSVQPIGSQGFFPETGYEEFGIEDPRITQWDSPLRLDNTEFDFVVSYVACSGLSGIATALAVSNDLESFHRLPLSSPGITFYPPQKDVVLFPERIRSPQTGEKYYGALIRPGAAHRYISPSIFLMTSPDLIHWGNPLPIVTGTSKDHVGGGVPPIKTKHGWLIIYHGRTCRAGLAQYEGWAALLDHDEPWRTIRRSPHPILRPLKTGDDDVISNVAFPTGAVLLNDGTLEIYLGLNDTVTAVARAPLEAILSEVMA
jgi:predicted GH43/DUF377 family glycosyl hydrolase